MSKKLVTSVNENKFNKNILLFVLLIIIILFIIVFSAINFYDSHKRNILYDDYSILQQQIILSDIYSSYLDMSSSEKCSVLKNELESYLIINNELYMRLKKINKNAIVESDDKSKLLFVLTNVKLWLHYNAIEKECNLKTQAMLYFYPEYKEFSVEKAKSDAETVVFVEKLNELSKKCDIRSIALPYIDYIPILNQMILDYNISKAPSVYINGKVYTDINLTSDFLEDINCN